MYPIFYRTAYFHQKHYVEARSVLLMGVDLAPNNRYVEARSVHLMVDLAPNNRSDFDKVISKLDEAEKELQLQGLVARNAGSELAVNGDPEHAELPEQKVVLLLLYFRRKLLLLYFWNRKLLLLYFRKPK